MVGPSRARCPTCKTPVATAADERPADYPFCSERCRLVDLHKWLTGVYSIPVANVPEEDGEEGKINPCRCNTDQKSRHDQKDACDF